MALLEVAATALETVQCVGQARLGRLPHHRQRLSVGVQELGDQGGAAGATPALLRQHRLAHHPQPLPPAPALLLLPLQRLPGGRLESGLSLQTARTRRDQPRYDVTGDALVQTDNVITQQCLRSLRPIASRRDYTFALVQADCVMP